MAAITAANVRAYTEQRLAAGAAPASINRELAVLKRAFSLAVKDGLLLARPHVPMLAEENTRQGFFEADEFEAVRAALPTELQGLVTFLYLAGWRIGEARPLEWSQVDRKRQTVRLEPGTTKNREGRTLPYGSLPELVEVLERQWSERERLAKAGTISPYVFHRDGQPIRSFRGAWERACAEAGVPGRLVHDLRRTAVRNLVRAGVPDTVAMRISGHKTRAVFDRYNVTSETDLADALGALAGSTGQDSGKKRQTGRVAEFARSS
jgi:integrase